MNEKYEFKTKRLKLRLINLGDLKDIHNLHSIAEVDEFNTLGLPKNIEDTEKIIKPWIAEGKKENFNSLTFAVEQLNTKKFIGLFGLKIWFDGLKKGEIWYKLLPVFWGKGYATEALIKMIEFGFRRLNLECIQAGAAVKNIGSIRVLEKAGMKRVRRGIKVLQLKNGWSDNYEYQLLKKEVLSLKL